MARSAADKAHQILAEGRLTVERMRGDGLIVARCKGFSDGEVYALGYDPRGDGEWRCTCKANTDFHRRCAHLMALQLVVVRPSSEERATLPS